MSETSDTYQPQELLSYVDAAIQNIMVGGQSYQLGNRSLTRADLSKLWEMRNTLAAQVAGEEDSCLMPNTCVVFFEGR